MYSEFFRDRIIKLIHQKGDSEREISLSLGQGHGYINAITSGKSLPSMESFFNICEYFHISPSEFFDDGAKYPTVSEELYNELVRVTKGDFLGLLGILSKLDNRDFIYLLSLISKISSTKEQDVSESISYSEIN